VSFQPKFERRQRVAVGEGSEFQTDGAEWRKAYIAHWVLVKSMTRNGVSGDRNVRANLHGFT